MAIELIDEIAIKNNPTQEALSSRRIKKGTGDGLAATITVLESGDKFFVFDISDGGIIKLVDFDNMPGGGLTLANIRKTATFVDGDLTAGILTVDVSTLSETGALHVTITDENSEDVIPDNVDQISTPGSVLIDLASYQPLSPTWRYRVSI